MRVNVWIGGGDGERGGRTEIISTPCAARAWASGLFAFRVMPLIFQSLLSWGWARMARMTEPPWFPVLPKTVMSLGMVRERSSQRLARWIKSCLFQAVTEYL